MIRRILVLFLAFFPVLHASAQALEKSLLWKISGNGIAQPSYIYGTVHAACEVSLENGTKEAIGKTGRLYLELDMDDPNMQSIMMAGMNMKDGKTMQQLVPAEDFEVADAFIQKELGISLKMLPTVKPFFISAMLIPKYMDCPAESVEASLMEMAKAKGQEVYGLESFEEQLAVFDAIPYEEQMKELVKTAKSDLKEDRKEFDAITKLYKAKDLDALQKASEESDNAMTSKYGDILLTDRNNNWIPRIVKIAKEKPTFFAVGAAHLGGAEGVIRKLRQAGYTVTAVY